jgi:Nucleopolyhedrovirus capsid protein P87
MEQKNNSVSIAVLTAKILTRDITKIDDINANIQDYDEKVTILYNLIVSEKELLDTATEQDRSHNQLQLLESAIDETRKNIQANNIMLAKYYFDRSIEYFKLIKNVNNKKSIEDTLESIRFEIQNMNDDNNDSNNEETVRQETYSQHVPHTTQSLMSPQPYEKTPLPNYSLHSPANFNEPSTSTQASTSNNLDITELWTQKIQAALQTEYYDDQVKEVFLYLINLALTYQQGTVYLTTYYNLKKLEQDLKSDIDLNDIYITFNLNDCDKITYLTLLAEKFLNKFRCQPNSLQDIVQAIQKYKDFINMSQEPLSIQNDFQEILQQNFDFDHLQPIKKSDYDNIKDKNVKLLFDVLIEEQKIFFENDGDSPVRWDDYETNDTVSSRATRKSITRKQNPNESTPSAPELTSDEEDDFLNKFQKERKRQKIHDEDFLRSRASEFSKTYENKNLKKLLQVTDSMKRLYDFCNCKNSLQTTPTTANYGSLIRKLNTYNMSFVEMNINFYELLFPLTLYDRYSSEVTFTIINYIFTASNYFQNCINNFIAMRNEFNKMVKLHQPDSVVMFVIKFNFICDMRNFVLQYLEDISPNRQPNMKILNVLIMRDKIVKKEFSKLQVQTYRKSSVAKNSKYLDKLIKLMNADFNII